jgi:hypothetical protein
MGIAEIKKIGLTIYDLVVGICALVISGFLWLIRYNDAEVD